MQNKVAIIFISIGGTRRADNLPFRASLISPADKKIDENKPLNF